jgi:hypothetical protein
MSYKCEEDEMSYPRKWVFQNSKSIAFCQSVMIDPPINQLFGGTSILICRPNNEF